MTGRSSGRRFIGRNSNIGARGAFGSEKDFDRGPTRSGEIYKAPADATGLRLLITSNAWPEHLLIGDEQSPFHGKTWFAL